MINSFVVRGEVSFHFALVCLSISHKLDVSFIFGNKTNSRQNLLRNQN